MGSTPDNTAALSLAVTDVAPMPQDDALTSAEDTAATTDVLANDGGDRQLTITGFADGANGTVTANGDCTFTYTPNADFNGSDAFSYTVSDGTTTKTASVGVTVTAVDDPPVAQDDEGDFEVSPGVVSLMIDVLANDIEVDGDPLTIIGVTQPTTGEVTDNGDGTLTMIGLSYGESTFTYTITDGDGDGGTDTATFSITVTLEGGVIVTAESATEQIASDPATDVMGLSSFDFWSVGAPGIAGFTDFDGPDGAGEPVPDTGDAGAPLAAGGSEIDFGGGDEPKIGAVSSARNVNGDGYDDPLVDAVVGAATDAGENVQIASDGDDPVKLLGLNTSDPSAGDFLLV